MYVHFSTSAAFPHVHVQRIHTMENLAELLKAGHSNGTHTLRDGQLEADVS